AEALSIGGGRADGVIGGAVGIDRIVVPGLTAARTDAVKRPVDVGIAQSSQTSASGLAGVHSGEALLHAAVGVDVHGRQGLDGGPLGSVEVPQPDEMVGQSAGLVAGPGVERGDELRLLDQPVL